MGKQVHGPQETEDNPVLDRAISKAMWRLVPVLILMYMLSYLDRANIGFAKQAFQASTGVTDIAFAFGASIFFIGYALFEFPSNLMLHKFGARRWMARIMITWGAIAMCMLFTHSDTSFTTVRFLLGSAEAGFFPGAILFITYWFPAKARGRILGLFYFGSPMAMMFGGPISGALLEMDGLLGLQGWQWLFLIEGIGTVIIGFFVLWYLTDRPAQAHWLTEEERTALADAVAAEDRIKEAGGHVTLGQALTDPRLIQFCAIYFLIQIAGYGFAFYMPSQVSGLLQMKIGLTVGFVSAIPWVCAIIAAIFYPPFAVKTGYRRTFGVIALLAIAGGLSASGNLPPAWAVFSLCFVAMGIICSQPIFWTFPSGYYTGYAAAGSLAVINATGNLGGFFAPNLKVWAEVGFGANAGLYAVAAAPFLAAILFVLLKDRVMNEPEAVEATEAVH
ncbi:MFS transporter [Telmatospirillum sp.]|uniref:MFS transporter n=1 Tax=Telmatospirillum sp. TaxID=2079197 RepID=UPI00283CD1C6|nr:MFS transporter [Telmatospirillum sp.]MDR3437033.1 MFS transporter [Telmatospirillum sp.]